MIKLKPTSGTLTANATIPLTTIFNTNNKMVLSNNAISIKQAGLVEVEGEIRLTATTTGEADINLLVDNTSVKTYSTTFAAIGDVASIPIYNLFRVLPSNIINGFTNISLQLGDAATITDGVITLKYIK